MYIKDAFNTNAINVVITLLTHSYFSQNQKSLLILKYIHILLHRFMQFAMNLSQFLLKKLNIIIMYMYITFSYYFIYKCVYANFHFNLPKFACRLICILAFN